MASKRLRAFASAADEELKVDMSPMIDMAFLLIIFFIMNANLIVVKMDKKVEVPVAPNSIKQETKNGRIVMNIYEDGVFATEDGRETSAFAEDDDKAIADYLRKGLNRQNELGYKPVLHIRADRGVKFAKARELMKIAASVGLKQMYFASYVTDK